MDSKQPPAPRPSARERFDALLAEWGKLLVVVYFSIFGVVLVGFAMAIKLGLRPESTTGTAGTWVAAWVATKVTQPLRIAATIIITPALGTLLRRFRRAEPAAQSAEQGVAAEDVGNGRSLENTASGDR